MNFEANDMNHMQWFNRLGKILDMERACMVALEAKVSLLNTHTHTHMHAYLGSCVSTRHTCTLAHTHFHTMAGGRSLRGRRLKGRHHLG